MSRTLYESDPRCEALALMSVTLNANVEHLEKSADGDDLLYHATERAALLAEEAVKDLNQIDPPRPIMEWQPATTDEALLAALQEYVTDMQPLGRVAKAGGAR